MILPDCEARRLGEQEYDAERRKERKESESKMKTRLVKTEIEFRCGVCGLGATELETTLKHLRKDHPIERRFHIIQASTWELQE